MRKDRELKAYFLQKISPYCDRCIILTCDIAFNSPVELLAGFAEFETD